MSVKSINITPERGEQGWALLTSNPQDFTDWFQALPCYKFIGDGESVTSTLVRRAARGPEGHDGLRKLWQIIVDRNFDEEKANIFRVIAAGIIMILVNGMIESIMINIGFPLPIIFLFLLVAPSRLLFSDTRKKERGYRQ